MEISSLLFIQNSIVVFHPNPVNTHFFFQIFYYGAEGSYSRSRVEFPPIEPFGHRINNLKCQVFSSDTIDIYMVYLCVIQNEGGSLSQFRVALNYVESANQVKISLLTKKVYQSFGSYQLVYLDFYPTFMVVKARTPMYPFSNMTEQKELMLLYQVNSTDSGQLYWGMTPDQYYSFKDQLEGPRTRFGVTDSLPLFVPGTYFSDANTRLFFTQNPLTQPDSLITKEDKRIGKEQKHLKKLSKTSDQDLIFKNSPQSHFFRRMNITSTQLKFTKKLYEDSANTKALLLNENSGAPGTHTSLIFFKNLILSLKPKPLPHPSNGFDNVPLWLIALMVVGVILAIVLGLLYFYLAYKKSG